MLDLPQFIRAEAKRAEFFAELVRRVDAVANLEQAEAESLALIEKNRITAQALIDGAKETAKVISAEANANHEKARSSIDAACLDGANIIANARVEAEKIISNATNRVAEARKAESQAKAEEQQAKERLDEARKELAEIEPVLADALATIAKAEAIKKAMG